MAFGVVVAGTGALSGTGGQKRYRVNRFRREIYRFGWAFGGGGLGNLQPKPSRYRLLHSLPSVYAPYISCTYVCVCVCSSLFIHGVHSVALPFFFPNLQSRIVLFFRRDNRFAALLECTRIYLCPTANPVRGGKVCLSSLLGLSNRGEWCIARITPVSIRIRKGEGKFSSFSIDSSIDFNCTIIEEEEKNGRALDMYRDMHATNVINERRCSCTRRILRNHVIRGNRSRDHAREEVISNYSTISEVALSDLASGLVDREWIIRERKKEKDQAFKLFAKLLLG